MKKEIMFLMLSLLLLFSVGCAAQNPEAAETVSVSPQTPVDYASDSSSQIAENDAEVANEVSNNVDLYSGEEQIIAPEPSCYDFEAQCIRTNGYLDGAAYPKIASIYSRAELEDYVSCNKENYDLTEFETAIEIYGQEWFDNGHMLLLIVLEEGSGSVRHEVTSLTRDCVTIDRTVPEVGTADMAEWHIIVAPDSLSDISERFYVNFTEGQPGRRFFGSPDMIEETTDASIP